MKFSGICIKTDNAPRLAEFYKTVFQKEPLIEGGHYGFGNFAVYDPGGIKVTSEKNISIQCFDADIDALYERLLRDIPNINVTSPPTKRPWGAYSFWFLDPDGNEVAVAQQEED